MTYIYGTICPPEKVDSKALEVLKTDLQRYPTDGHVVLSGDMMSGGLFYQNLRKPPFQSEKPIKDEISGVIVFASARLDYRLGLLKQLGIDSSQLNVLSDSQLILKAYLKWGEDCPNFLEGDFSFFIWNPSKQYLWGARDPIGFKPLFFTIQDEICFFSSHTTGLAKLSGVDRRPDEGFFGNRFVRANCSLMATPYRGIQQVPVGHSVKVDRNKASMAKYFHWQTVPIHEKISSEDYASELKGLLSDAIETRLYADYPVGGYLSGGLDSSAVLAMAQSFLGQKKAGGNLITASSVHASGSNDPREDERPWVEAFKRHFPKIQINCCTLQNIPAFCAEDTELFTTMRLRRYPTRFMEEMLEKKLMEEGCRTYLTGWRGDHYVSRRGYAHYTDLLKLGKVGQFCKAVRDTAKFTERSPKSLIKAIVSDNIPKKAFDPIDFYGVEFLNKKWVKDLVNTNGLQSKQRPWWKLNDLNYDFSRLLPDRQGTMQYYEDTTYKHDAILTRLTPLSDPRVINFALKLPAEEYSKGGMDRSIMRRALKGVIPDELRLRNTKGSFMDNESSFSSKLHEQWLNQENILDIVDQSPLNSFINSKEIKKYITQYRRSIKRKDVGFHFENTYFLNLLGFLFYFKS